MNYSDGYEKGFAEGQESANEELRARVERLESLLDIALCPADCDKGFYSKRGDDPIPCMFCVERYDLIGTRPK